jgi:predicted nucleic acid-binding protein
MPTSSSAPHWAPKVVIDPVSVCLGLVYGDPQSLKLLELCREGKCIPLISKQTYQALWARMSSPQFAFAPETKRKSMLREFVQTGVRLKVRQSAAAQADAPESLSSILLAMAGQAQVLITPAPQALPRAPGMNFRVMSPAAFLNELVPEVHHLPHRRPVVH